MSKPILIKVRHTPKHSCIAHLSKEGDLLKLCRVTPEDGPLPDISKIVNTLYVNRTAIRNDLIELMRATSV